VSAKGIFVSPSRFVPFAEPGRSLSTEVATRERSQDFAALGMMLPNPDPILRKMGKAIDVYTELESDPHVQGCLVRRRGAVTSLEMGIVDGSAPARVMKECKAILADLDIKSLIQDCVRAAAYGYQPVEVMWGQGRWQVPTRLIAKPQEWFGFDPDGDLRFLSRGAGLQGEALEPKKFLIPRHRPTYKNPYGFADLSMCFWPVTFKKGGFKFWLKFTEKYGMPWPVGKYPRGTNPGEVSDLLDKLENMVQDGVAAIPADDSVEILTLDGSNNAEAYERFLLFCRSEVSIGLLGQNQTTEATANKASAQAGIEVLKDIRDDDAALAESAVNTLLDWICELNFGDGPRPVWSLWEQSEVDEVLAQRDERLVKSGVRFTRSYWLRSYNLQDTDLAAEPAAVAPSSQISALAEFDTANFPAQTALDDAIEQLAGGGELQAQAEQLLQPVFRALEGASNDDQIAAGLLRAYPDMDATRLTQTMTRLYFAAELIGRLGVAAELANDSP
jgi:phage gp29-like protein